MAKHRSEEQRAREVSAWRASGESASVFAARRGYSKSTLRCWASRSALESPRFVRVEVVPQRASAVVVEVGFARVRVAAGFDAELLRAVVSALSGAKT